MSLPDNKEAANADAEVRSVAPIMQIPAVPSLIAGRYPWKHLSVDIRDPDRKQGFPVQQTALPFLMI
ncbi:MAG: hypothetical protein QM684_07225 [Rhizobium sp.]